MSNIDSVVTWENGVGTIDENKFRNGLPEGLTMDLIEATDNYRDSFTADLSGATLDYAGEFFKDEPEGTLSIPGINLGGNATTTITMDSDLQLLAEITVSENKALTSIMEKAQVMYEANIDS